MVECAITAPSFRLRSLGSGMTETPNPTIERLRERLVSAMSPGSVAARARARRWQTFAAYFPEVGDMRVLDLGGTTLTWMNAPTRPREVVIVNLKPQPSDVDWISTLVGDACALPRRVADQRFDLAYSN